MRKLLALVLALVMTLGLATVGTNAFTDDTAITATSYNEAVQVLAGMGVFKGYEDGSFQPTKTISRAEVAAIIYRIATGDVEGKKVANYEGLANFTDMSGYGWASGYIGYCANAGYVKGYGNGKFGPGDPVTGYQACAMILRAVGFDKNHEWEGAGYEVKVASTATTLSMLKTIEAASLTGSANRATVAQILFDALQANQRIYSLIEQDYIPYNSPTAAKVAANLNKSLGEQNFNFAKKVDFTYDEWGRLATLYTYSTGDKKTVFPYPATYTTHDETRGCDIYDGIGKKTTIAADQRYNNGVRGDAHTVADKTTIDGDTGFGRLIEYYTLDDGKTIREVIVDTYLARVIATVAEAKDANGHVIRDAYNTLRVYDTAAGNTFYIKGNDYATGDWLLVHVNRADGTAVNTITNEDNRVTLKRTTTDTTKTPLVVFEAKPETVEAAQTKLFLNQNKHEIGGKEYTDACQFNLDPAGATLTYKMQWFFDQYGYVIGDTELNRNDYAVLENIRYIAGSTEYAEATLRYFDGSTKTVTVRHMDGFGWYDNEWKEYNATRNTGNQGWLGQVDDANFRLAENGNWRIGRDDIGYQAGTATADGTAWGLPAAFVSISSSANLNSANGFAGLALYRVWTYDDGSVDLEAFEQGTGVGADVTDPFLIRNQQVVAGTNRIVKAPGNTDTNDTVDIKFIDNALVDPTTSAVVTLDANNRKVVQTNLGATTKFIYRSGRGTAADPYVYTTYTGVANIPTMTRDFTAEVFFDGNASSVSSYVYVKTYTPNVQQGMRHVFILDKNSSYMTVAGTGVYVIDAVVDGVTTTVAGTQAQIAYLDNNKLKMFHITFMPGVAYNLIPANWTVDDLRNTLVNEASDENDRWHQIDTNNGNPGECDYLALNRQDADHTTVAGYTKDTHTLIADTRTTDRVSTLSYNVANAKFHGRVTDLADFEAKVVDGALKDYGIWIVSNNTNDNPFLIATDVYVGEKLKDNTNLTVKLDNGSAVVTSPRSNNGHTTVAGGLNTDVGAIKVNMEPGESTAAMAFSSAANGTVNVTDRTINKANGDQNVVVRVTAEDGYHHTLWTVTPDFRGVVESVMVSRSGVPDTQFYHVVGGTVTDLQINYTESKADADADKLNGIRGALGKPGVLVLAPTIEGTPVNVTVKGLPTVSVKIISATNEYTAITELNKKSWSAPGVEVSTGAQNTTNADGGIIIAELKDANGYISYLAFRMSKNENSALNTAKAGADGTIADLQTRINAAAGKDTTNAAALLATLTANVNNATSAGKVAEAINNPYYGYEAIEKAIADAPEATDPLAAAKATAKAQVATAAAASNAADKADTVAAANAAIDAATTQAEINAAVTAALAKLPAATPVEGAYNVTGKTVKSGASLALALADNADYKGETTFVGTLEVPAGVEVTVAATETLGTAESPATVTLKAGTADFNGGKLTIAAGATATIDAFNMEKYSSSVWAAGANITGTEAGGAVKVVVPADQAEFTNIDLKRNGKAIVIHNDLA